MSDNTRLTNTVGTTSTGFAIDEMKIEHIRSGSNAGTKISYPGLPPIYLRARNPFTGSKWYNGETDPDEDLGNEDDYYLKTTTGQIFHRINGTWNFISDLTGPSGGQGSQGDQGDAGPAGPPGPAAAISLAADADITNPSQDHILTYDALVSKWKNTDASVAFGTFAVALDGDQFIRGDKTFNDTIDATSILSNTPNASENSRAVATTEWVKDITTPLANAPYLTIGATTTLDSERILNLSSDFVRLDNGAGGTFDVDLSTTGITAGTYTKLTVDNKGRVTTGTILVASDLPSSGVTPGTYTKLTVDTYGRITVGASLVNGDLPDSGIDSGSYSKVSVNSKGIVTGYESLISDDLPTVQNLVAGTYTKVSIDTKGRVIDTGTFTNSDLPSSGVTPGTYSSVTVNDKGVITAASTFDDSLLPDIISAGTFTKVTIDDKGRVTSGTALENADLPTVSGLSSGTYTKLTINSKGIVTGGTILAVSDLPDSGISSGTYASVTVDAKGRVTAGGNLTSSDLPTVGTSGTYTKVSVDAYGRVSSGTTLTDGDVPSSLARVASPTFTGIPAAPTPASDTNTTQIATTAFVQTAVSSLLGGATPETLDTLNELANALGDDPNFAATVTSDLATKLVKSANLSDLTNPTTARQNLGTEIGVDVQAFSDLLASFSGLTTAADKAFYTTAEDTVATYDLTSFGRSLTSSSTAANVRTLLALGDLAVVDQENLSLSGLTADGDATTILIKKSGSTGVTPSAGDLEFGELFLNYNDGNIYYKDSDSQVQILNVSSSGQPGPQGATGPTGPTGPQGIQGIQGVQGDQGPQGIQGETGDQGPQGDAGPQGIQGIQGPTGDQGIQGEQGVAGPQGDAGPQGIQGPTGPTGPIGPQGSAGPAGVDGRTVLNGTGAPSSGIGIDGDFYLNTDNTDLYGPKTSGAWGSPISLIGADGADGPAGEDGAQGPQGIQGIQGDAGPTGPTGPAGANGTNGTDGEDGTNAVIATYKGTYVVPTSATVTTSTAFPFDPVQYDTLDGIEVLIKHTGLGSSVKLAIGTSTVSAIEIGTFDGDGVSQWRMFFVPFDNLNETQTNNVYIWSTNLAGGTITDLVVAPVARNQKSVHVSREIIAGLGLVVGAGDGTLSQDVRLDLDFTELTENAAVSQDMFIYSDASTGGTARKRTFSSLKTDLGIVTTADYGSGNGIDADTLDGIDGSDLVNRVTDTSIEANHTYLDDYELRFGTGSDFVIYHPTSGEDTYFINQNHNGSILFQVENESNVVATVLDIKRAETVIKSDGTNKLTINSSGATVHGNLTVTGTTTTVNSNQVDIGDNIIVLNSDEAGVPSQNAGFEIERGTSSNVSWLWNESNTYFTPNGQLIGNVADPTLGTHLGDRDYNDARYFQLDTTGNDITANKNFANDVSLYFKDSGGVTSAFIRNTDSDELLIQNNSDIIIKNSADTIFKVTDANDVSVIEADLTAETVSVYGNRVLTTADEGSGNGIDADTLDGIQGSDYARISQSNTFADNLIVSGVGKTIRLREAGPGATIVDASTPGLELIAGTLDTTNKYPPIIKFMSDDSDLSTESPKLLGAIVGRATQSYSDDTKSGLALDFYTSPNDGGTSDTTVLALSISETGISDFKFTPTVNGSNILTVANEGPGNGIDADTVDGIEGASIVTETKLTNYSLNPRFENTIGFEDDPAVIFYDNTGDDARTGYWADQDVLTLAGSGGLASNIVLKTGNLEVSGNAWYYGNAGFADQVRIADGTAGAPGLVYQNAQDTGLFNSSGDIGIAVGGTDIAHISAGGFELQAVKGPALLNETTSSTNPTVIPNRSNPTTGIGQGLVNTMYMVIDSTAIALVDSSGITITGALNATQKSFVIDHPIKENYKLRYGSLEGPENGVYVRGRSKKCVIELPNYWVELVDGDSITVSLTPMGKAQDIYVEKIEDNKVYVSSKNFIKHWDFFYHVFAERKDVDKLVTEYETN